MGVCSDFPAESAIKIHDSPWDLPLGEGRLRRRRMNFTSMNEQKLNQVKSNMSVKDKEVYEVSLCAKKPPKACVSEDS